MARALAVPCFFSCFCFHSLARSLPRRNRQAISPKAQRRCALPIFLPPEPSFLPADSWSHGARRQIVLGVEDLQVGDQLGPFVDQIHAAAKQVTRLAHAP